MVCRGYCKMWRNWSLCYVQITTNSQFVRQNLRLYERHCLARRAAERDTDLPYFSQGIVGANLDTQILHASRNDGNLTLQKQFGFDPVLDSVTSLDKISE